MRRCLAETGVDVSGFDVPPQTAKSTRKDRAAVERMRKTGITEKDLKTKSGLDTSTDGTGSFIIASAMLPLRSVSMQNMSLRQETLNLS